MTIATLQEYTKIFTQSTSLEVKAHGEVYTPLSLVTQMLDKLPPHAWSNPSLTWFEPACGLSPFLFLSYQRLMIGLEVAIPDKENRSKHIIESMFYFNEVQEKNLTRLKQLFNASTYKLNLFEGDAMTVVPSDFKADIIVANPPYNTSTNNRGTGHSCWQKFVTKGLKEWLRPNGYLLYVTPSLWRQGDDDVLPLIKQHDLLYLAIHNESMGLKTFGRNTRYDIYLICNQSYNSLTEIVDELGKVVRMDVSPLTFLPNCHFELVSKLLASKSDEKAEVVCTYVFDVRRPHMSKERDEVHKYPCILSVNKANQPKLSWSSINNKGLFGVPKVVFANGATGVLVDRKGEYGLSQWAKAIVADVDELDGIRDALLSSTFTQVTKAIAVGQASINHKILERFKKDFWREILATPLSAVPAVPSVDSMDNCQAVTREGNPCTRKGVNSGYCKQHKGYATNKTVGASSVKLSEASSSSSASLDRQKLTESIGKNGYTVDQLKSYCREKQLKFKSSDKKAVLRELLLTS